MRRWNASRQKCSDRRRRESAPGPWSRREGYRTATIISLVSTENAWWFEISRWHPYRFQTGFDKIICFDIVYPFSNPNRRAQTRPKCKWESLKAYMKAAYMNVKNYLPSSLFISRAGCLIKDFYSIEELLSAFVDCIKANHSLLRESELMYRDITVERVSMWGGCMSHARIRFEEMSALDRADDEFSVVK